MLDLKEEEEEAKELCPGRLLIRLPLPFRLVSRRRRPRRRWLLLADLRPRHRVLLLLLIASAAIPTSTTRTCSTCFSSSTSRWSPTSSQSLLVTFRITMACHRWQWEFPLLLLLLPRSRPVSSRTPSSSRSIPAALFLSRRRRSASSCRRSSRCRR